MNLIISSSSSSSSKPVNRKKCNIENKKNHSSRNYVKTVNRLMETTKKGLIECNPKKINFASYSSECFAIWSEVEDMLERLDTIQRIDELDDLDFKI